jgi:hypothetical protein
VTGREAGRGDSALVQELVSTRAAMQQAIGIGERLQARVDAALAIVEQLAPSTVRDELLAALRGEQ